MLGRILVICICTKIVLGQDQTKIVHLNQGPVRGYKISNRDVFSFLGIPYATEPKGNDKFKAPLPPPTWTATFDAKTSNMCPQQILSNPNSLPDNCLVVNVFTPDTIETNLPVLVFFHGGGFYIGSGDMQRPTTLVDSKQIVAVTVNYRLGIHGFLCLGTESSPGNAGMKDQNAALRWVQENIAKFGGNPNDVTIAGSSAGSASVNLHLLSKMSRGLFHKLIPDSASALAVYSTQQDPIANAKSFVKRIKNTMDINDSQALEDFYLQTPLSELIKQILDTYGDWQIDFVPCVEKDLGIERFLETSPYSIIKSGDFPKLPKLEGFANMEGLQMINNIEKYTDMNSDFSKYLPGNLEFKSKEQKDEVAQAVKQFYFGDRKIGPNTALEFIDYFSDTGFTYSILRAIKLQLEAGMDEIYLYEYAFVDDNTPYVLNTNEKGANHAAQTGTVMESLLDFLKKDSDELIQMKATMKDIWLNFITTGKPVSSSLDKISSWPKVTTFNSPYMLLNQTSSIETSLLQKRFKLWDNIYEKYYMEPQPPNNGGFCNSPLFVLLSFISSILISTRFTN